MVFLYKFLNKKFDSSLAMYFFLLLHIAIWFFTGAAIGALLSLLLFQASEIFTFSVTSGAVFAIALGYVYGYIVIIKNA